jgi:hypothetical protein
MGLLEGRCTETITVKRKTSHGLGGDPVRGATVTMAARIERVRGETTSPDGQELTYSARVFTEPPNEVLASDLIFFPEDSTADTEPGREVVRVEAIADLDGVLSHYEVLI